MVSLVIKEKVIQFSQFSSAPDTRGRRTNNSTPDSIKYSEHAAHLYKILSPSLESETAFPVAEYLHPDGTEYRFITLGQDESNVEQYTTKLIRYWKANMVILDKLHESDMRINEVEPLTSILVPHYNWIIAELGHIDLYEALEAVVALNWPQDSKEREVVKMRLIKLFGVTAAQVNGAFTTVRRYRDNNLIGFVGDAAKTLDDMDEVANSLSWQLLQDFKGELIGKNIVVLAGREHRSIFEPGYKLPEGFITLQNKTVQQLFDFYEVLTIQPEYTAPRGVNASKIQVSPEKRLKELLTAFSDQPKNEIMRAEIVKMLRMRYEDLVMSEDYEHAAEDAQRLREFGVEDAGTLHVEVLITWGEKTLEKLRKISEKYKRSKNNEINYIEVALKFTQAYKVVNQLRALRAGYTDQLLIGISELEKWFYPNDDGA